MCLSVCLSVYGCQLLTLADHDGEGLSKVAGVALELALDRRQRVGLLAGMRHRRWSRGGGEGGLEWWWPVPS